MKNITAVELSNEELADRFAIAAKERAAAVLALENRRANTLFGVMRVIDHKLRSRGDSRRILVPLLDDGDRFVRFYAAIYLLGLVPEKSRAVLEWNAKYAEVPIAADARVILLELDRGTYKPD